MSKESEYTDKYIKLLHDSEARARELESELADTKAQLEYVRATVRVREELARELDAEVERVRVSCAGMRKAMEHAETRELAALGELDAYRAAMAEVRKFYMVPGSAATLTAILDKLPQDKGTCP